MTPTLFILAAGMGSRYGGLKQLDGIGPGGATIMDYSVYDALEAGFGKIVFVIRKSFKDDFKKQVVSKYKDKVPVKLVYQELDKLPKGFTCPPDRTKPWGTGHAVLMGMYAIKEPFAVINADDFYGRETFEVLAKQLRYMSFIRKNYCMVSYHAGNTISESGSVSRGICTVDENNFLASIVERTHIVRDVDGKIKYKDENGTLVELDEKTPVSMNVWGFTPDFFTHTQKMFEKFLESNADSLTSEFYIPTVVNNLITSGKVTCQVLETSASWFGVTYPQDTAVVQEKLHSLVEQGIYPHQLF
ncbi:MAG: nucleotidyltransferase [Bacteroidales bacterium]|jgi:dTDP-glucose pyrophosphorylase|nr:nucleotidyltransferase [Bacteroidales bacterium]